MPDGGPDGGDGGRGGDVLVIADSTDTTLSGFRERRSFRAEDGRAGGGAKRSGHHGADLTLHVPVGTIVRNGDVVLADLDRPGAVALAARGGRGGRGNTRFATATRQAPRAGELGDPGEAATPASRAPSHRRYRPGGAAERRQIDAAGGVDRCATQDRRVPVHHPASESRGRRVGGWPHPRARRRAGSHRGRQPWSGPRPGVPPPPRTHTHAGPCRRRVGRRRCRPRRAGDRPRRARGVQPRARGASFGDRLQQDRPSGGSERSRRADRRVPRLVPDLRAARATGAASSSSPPPSSPAG